MKRFRTMLPVASLTMLLSLSGFDHVSAQCVSGTLAATFQTSGPHADLWKYVVDITWTTPQGLSNVTLDCGFGQCAESACALTYDFDVPAGQSDGEPAGCVVDFDGEFNCNGNPSIGMTDPIVKWDAIDTGSCEPGKTGSGQLVFYVNRGPQPNSQAPIILIKNGQQVCAGVVVGDCPAACTVSVEGKSWGWTKSIYR